MLNINAYSGLGSIKVKPPSPPGSPIIAFLAENVTADAWANSGSGGATYNATKSGTPILGNPIGDFNSVRFKTTSDYMTLASEYVLPSTAIVACVVQIDGYSEYAVPLGQNSVTNGGHSRFELRNLGYVDADALDDAGNSTFQTTVGYMGPGNWVRGIFDRTSAANFTHHANGSSAASPYSLVSSIRIGRIGRSNADTRGQFSTSYAEILVYPDRAITWDQIDAYFKAKFMIP
jgi:hypothetical protein